MTNLDKKTRTRTAKQIYQYRMKLGMSVVEFAKKYGVSRSTVYCWENGTKIPKIEHTSKLCEDMDIPIDDLIEIKCVKMINPDNERVSSGYRQVVVDGVYYKTLASACREYKIKEFVIKNIANYLDCSLGEAITHYNSGYRLSRGPRLLKEEHYTDSPIYQLRIKLGYTRDEFARRFNVSLSTVCRWEIKRAIPSHNIIEKMAVMANMDDMEFYLELTK